jgi:hypothetical protein
MASRTRSANAPSVAVLSVEPLGPAAVASPVGPGAWSGGAGGADGAGAVLTGSVRITWSAEDPDGDALVSHVLYSPDGGERWIPIAVDLAAT